MGGLGGKKCKSLENLPTDWHQIWYTVCSSRNGHRLKTISDNEGAFGGGGVRGKKFN